MTLSQDIAIIDLLRQREADFVVVWKCEQKIKDLLGDVDFPFPAPGDLPSRRRRDARKAPTREKRPVPEPPPEPAGTAGKTEFPEIRKLESARENAYRLVFLRHGLKDSSFQTDFELIKALAGLNCPEFKLLSLETVYFTDLDNWQVIETLWADSPDGQ